MMGVSWAELWYYAMLVSTLFIVFEVLFHKESGQAIAPVFSYRLIFLLMPAIAWYFAAEPILKYSDKWLYEADFKKINSGIFTAGKDIGYYLYVWLVSWTTDSAKVFFFVTALVYMIGYYIFIRKHVVEKYRFLLFFTVIASMGFYPYGNNTLRAGLALSLFLLLLSRPYFFKLPTLLIIAVIVLIHKSLLLPVTALLISLLYRPKDHFLSFWVVCFILSLAAGSTFVNFFGEFFSFADERVTQYTAENNQIQYKTGFRWDFVIYSVLPILLARYYQKKGFRDKLYGQMLSMYILSNAVWLLLISMPYSDRFATLSWFLIPVLIMYPLLTKRIFEKQHFWIAGVLFVNMLIAFTLNMKS